MKIPLTAALLGVLSWPSRALAHNDVEFVAHGGINSSANLPVTMAGAEGSASFDLAPVFGVAAGYRIEQDGFVYLSYSHSEATGYFRPNGQPTVSSGRGIAFDYFQFGGYLEGWRGPLAGFLGFSLGAVRLSALGGPGNDVHFAAMLEGGAKIEIIHELHVRLTGRMPVNFVSGESQVFCVVGGCVATLHGDPLLQLQALIGLGVGF